jgi:hypothetical protein
MNQVRSFYDQYARAAEKPSSACLSHPRWGTVLPWRSRAEAPLCDAKKVVPIYRQSNYTQLARPCQGGFVILVLATLDFRAGAGPFHSEKIKFHTGLRKYSSMNNCISIMMFHVVRGVQSVPIGAALCREQPVCNFFSFVFASQLNLWGSFISRRTEMVHGRSREYILSRDHRPEVRTNIRDCWKTWGHYGT